jgi:hypothetical protein
LTRPDWLRLLTPGHRTKFRIERPTEEVAVVNLLPRQSTLLYVCFEGVELLREHRRDFCAGINM